MESLFEIALRKVISGGHQSLRKLPSSLRKRINLAWFNQTPCNSPWQDKLKRDFPSDPYEYYLPTSLVWQDEGVTGDFVYRVPMYTKSLTFSRRKSMIQSVGFVYRGCSNGSYLTLFHVHAYMDYRDNHDQLCIELLPSKDRIRQLQTLVLPLVVPYLNPKEFPNLDWVKYHEDLNDLKCQHKIENHWADFFGV